MKSIVVLLSLLLVISMNNIAQNSGNQKTGSSGTDKSTTKSSTSDTKSNTGSSGNWSSEKVNEFVMKASNGGMMEVQLGKLAQQKATNQQVKDFAQMMVKDHSDANAKLKSTVKGTTLPTTLDKKHQDDIDKLNSKSGKDFDKDYIDMMVKDHENDVKEFEDAQDNVSDPALKGWITSTLPVLNQHLQKAKAIQDQLKK